MVANKVPLVFAWDELDPGSVFRAKLALLALERGGERNLTAEDHFGLGREMLRRDRNVVAINEFNQAKRLDRSYANKVRLELDRHRRERAAGVMPNSCSSRVSC